MDHKPLITYGGDAGVFQSVAPSLQKGMGGEAVEWKRVYGRATKHVHLHPRFIPFNAGAGGVPKEDGSSAVLTTLHQPMLHTFWTDCSDVEVYRTTTKDVIQTWLNQVKASNIRDWLLVLVETPENKKTKQLLPRTSVLDKIRSDFAQKQVERCISLSDPTKLDSKSAESLHAMLHRLRQLLLASYSKALTKFEENMRAQREKRNEPGWNFCHYFLLQEELAFVLEMLEVYDEALVQYDELDALFTQFVLNSHLTDTPQWLLSFQRSGDQWPALTLSPASTEILLDTREKIRNSSVSLISFRNYLFARQASLLIKQKRLNELAQRSLPFLHNEINELTILDVTFTEEGAISAWVFVSCLEILGTACGHGQGSPTAHTGETVNGNGVVDHISAAAMSAGDFSVHTAGLWDYAREKLYELGKLCDLLPGSQPKSDHLHKVISLAAGLLPFQQENNLSKGVNHLKSAGGGKEEESIEIRSLPILLAPIEKLKNALSSKEQFETYYLELCELAMGTYKHIGRIRSARKVGLSLASYYVDAGEHQKAISFLTDALKTFKDDKWSLLVVEVLLKLANSYKATNDLERYLKTCAQLASSKLLANEKRDYFFKEFVSSLDSICKESVAEGLILSSTEDVFWIKSLRIETSGKINVDSCDVSVHLEIESQFPDSLASSSVAVGILPCDMSASHSSATSKPSSRLSGDKNLKEGGKSRLERKESLLPVPAEDDDIPVLEGNPSQLRLQFGQTFETKQDRSIQGGKLTCHNPHIALRRKDSQVKNETQLIKTDFSISVTSSNIQLHPGLNSLLLHGKVPSAGAFRLGQVSICVKALEYVSPRLGSMHTFSVERVQSQVALGEGSLTLIAGIEQALYLEIHTGSNQITHGMTLQVRSSVGLQLKSHDNSPLCTEISLPLPSTKPLGQVTVRLKVKAELGPQKDNTPIQHKLIVKCPWSGEEKKLAISFQPPFMSSFKVHSTGGSRKFVQVLFHGLSDNTFLISNHKLAVQGVQAKDVPLVPLNARSQELPLKIGENASYLFEIGVNELDDSNSTRFEFSSTFRPLDNSHPPELYKFYFSLNEFKTQYEIKYRVEPHKGLEFCRVGTMCSLVVEILKVLPILRETIETSLMYEVRADQHMWAICGRTSGVVSMEGVEVSQVVVEVMPMSPGFLPLPTVYLSNYIPADQKGNASSVPKLEPFHSGQVFNRCKGMQIHVLPPYSGSATTGTISGTSSLTNDNTYFPVSEYSE